MKFCKCRISAGVHTINNFFLLACRDHIYLAFNSTKKCELSKAQERSPSISWLSAINAMTRKQLAASMSSMVAHSPVRIHLIIPIPQILPAPAIKT
jgi:hypothetical protein